jgi:hypothetical protein
LPASIFRLFDGKTLLRLGGYHQLSLGTKAASSREQQRLSSYTVHGLCGKRGIAEFLKDRQEKKWRCIDRPVDALGLTNESRLSCFPCVLCFSSFFLRNSTL